MSGKLVLVATPIGNLGDITLRAAETLKTASVIACEDTRHTRKLLNHLNIRDVPVVAVHEHNEAAQADAIVERVRSGDVVALVTDAGTPGISDPGERVVAAVAAASLEVTVTPGPSASIAALVVSGLPAGTFTFIGFVERKGPARHNTLQQVAQSRHTCILYEAPQRLHATLVALQEVCGSDRRVAVVRELTKIHEQVIRGTLATVALELDGAAVKGECVIVVESSPAPEPMNDAAIVEELRARLTAGSTKRDAVTGVAAQFRLSKNHVYDIANRL